MSTRDEGRLKRKAAAVTVATAVAANSSSGWIIDGSFWWNKFPSTKGIIIHLS